MRLLAADSWVHPVVADRGLVVVPLQSVGIPAEGRRDMVQILKAGSLAARQEDNPVAPEGNPVLFHSLLAD